MTLKMKEWIAKVSDFINKNKVQTLTFTGTTNAQGAVAVPNSLDINSIILRVSCTNYTNALCIPFVYDNRLLFVKCFRWDTWAVISNTSLNLVVKYHKGGVVRKLLKALKPLTSERGWAV